MQRIPRVGSSSATALAFAASLVFLALWVALNWLHFVDDAYIFFRYAHNLAAGDGYVLNPGHWVEGTTSVTWTLLLALVATSGIPLEASTKVLCFACIIGCFILIADQSRRDNVPASLLLLGLVLLAANQAFVQSIMLGLETGLYALLLLGLVIAVGRLQAPAYPLALGPLGLLLFLTRPDALLLLGLLGLGLLCLGPEARRPVLITLGIWLAGIALITLARLLIFGDAIPNSARAKAALSESLNNLPFLRERLTGGGIYVRGWLTSIWPLGLPALFALVPLYRHRPLQAYTAVAIGGALVGVAMLNSGDWMPFYRLLSPFIPIMALLAIGGAGDLAYRWPIGQRAMFSLVPIAIAVWVAGASLASSRGQGWFQAQRWMIPVCYDQLGQALAPQIGPATVFAPEALGEIGYRLPQVQMLDFFGLTEPYIARNGTMPLARYSYGRHHYEWTMRQQPDLFLFHSDVRNHIPWLNRWGYSTQYTTYELTGSAPTCSFTVGIRNDHSGAWLSAIQPRFQMRLLPTADIPENTAVPWPFGLR